MHGIQLTLLASNWPRDLPGTLSVNTDSAPRSGRATWRELRGPRRPGPGGAGPRSGWPASIPPALGQAPSPPVLVWEACSSQHLTHLVPRNTLSHLIPALVFLQNRPVTQAPLRHPHRKLPSPGQGR